MKSQCATISARQSRKVRPQGPPGVVPQVPQACADGPGSDAGSGSFAADRSGARIAHHLGQGSGGPCAHVHQLSGAPEHQPVVQWLKGTSSRPLFQEFPHLKKQYWGQHLWARGYFAVTSGTITDEMINEYINEQEGEPVHEDDSRFQIDPS